MGRTIALIVATFFSCCDSASGQLFGSRSIRRNLARQESNTVGQIQGNERYIRGRRQDAFVGSDQGDRQGFVGNEQARSSGRIASPTGGIQTFVDRTSQINRPLPALKKSEFYPGPLTLPADLWEAIVQPVQTTQLNQELTKELSLKVNDSIEVSVTNRTARLQGEVASSKEKVLAELLVRFEPGIDDIVNEIEVVER